ncbi:MAG: DHA2 family efflux MFS transporter permease subunit [Candidatus Eremiobacteraeota bacterium]|nr:DHA2 family efflux MFS transporter permease subunit [Candidatus Eremiobacteraeota bacterium]
MLMIVLDGTVVNVALPSIQSDLGFSQANLAWVVNAYMIAFGGLLLLAGRLGDLIGAKRVFIVGLVAFTVASILCGVAWSQPVLIAARFLQGIGGALASSVILAMIVTMFTQPAERARAMGIFSFTASAGGSVGLLIGGTITQFLNWHWVFLINVPIGIATFFVARKYLDTKKGIGLQDGADLLGAVLITACLMLAVYTVVEVPNFGLTSMHTLVFGATAVVLFIAFIARQLTASKPLVDLSVFKSRNVSGSNVLEVLIVAGLFGFFFLDSLYLRRAMGYGPVATGLAFLPITLSIGAFSLGWSAQLCARFGALPVVVTGCALAAAGLLIFAITPLDAAYVTRLMPPMLLMGIGMGVSFPPLMMFGMSDATPQNSGLISGVIQTSAQVGGAFGLAILATSAAARTHGALAAGAKTVAALSAGYHFAFWVAAAFMILATIVAATVLTPIDFSNEAQTEDYVAA